MNAIANWLFGRGREARRPGRHRHAQLSRMAADLLGLRLHRRRRGRHERLVGGRRDGLRAEGLRAEGDLLRRRAPRADPASARRWRPAPSWSRRASTRSPAGVIAWRRGDRATAARCRTSRSIPTPTPASSTPPARPAFPKGAQLTHRGCIANLFNMMFSGQVQALADAARDRRRARSRRAADSGRAC